MVARKFMEFKTMEAVSPVLLQKCAVERVAISR